VRRAGTWLLTLLVSLAALVGLIALFNSKDQSGVDKSNVAASAGPGSPYSGDPALSPADQKAVKLGNVVVLYRDARPPAGTRALVPPGGRALEQAGQSVLLVREPSLPAPLAGVSAKKIQEANTPAELQPFIDYWLGGG
jgi:hypothetical protein